ncbi:histidine phosphatase family protein [Cumulibacter soli]|uniref:histidine phosphatase family protein n=1 Tax=Cumulibacter soli TaxID=2546344 RepID=UPI0014195580|nr:histidine phosphatase family protein [Cumulibacter soli]
MKLYLVRHAESEANRDHVIACSIPGPDLTDLGRLQAETLADRLKDADIEAIYHSRMTRTKQTAMPLAHRLGMEMVELDGFHEVDLGDLGERADVEAYEAMDKLATSWNVNSDLEQARPGGESGQNVVDRMTAEFERIRNAHGDSDGAVVAVAHGLCLRTATQRWADGVSLDFAYRNVLPNTAIIEVDVPADRSQRPRILEWAGIDPATTGPSEGGIL